MPEPTGHVFDHNFAEAVYECECGYVTAYPGHIEAHAKGPGRTKPIRVWVDRQHYDFYRRLMTGAGLRAAASIPAGLDLWYEAPTPDREDVRVPEAQGFALLEGARFYSSPRSITAGTEPAAPTEGDGK